MTSTHDDDPRDETPTDVSGDDKSDGATQDRETPEVGLIADEELPEDLRPTDDNPLAQDPDESDDAKDAGPGGESQTVEGMPDMGSPA